MVKLKKGELLNTSAIIDFTSNLKKTPFVILVSKGVYKNHSFLSSNIPFKITKRIIKAESEELVSGNL